MVAKDWNAFQSGWRIIHGVNVGSLCVWFVWVRVRGCACMCVRLCIGESM